MTDIEQQARKEAEEKYPLGADSGYAYMDKWARDHIKSLRVGYAAALISERSKPSLMVGFSEEEMERVARSIAQPLAVGVAREALRYANRKTRAVSIDRLVEVVKESSKCTLCDGEGSIGPEPCRACCETGLGLPDVDLLRERLMKIMP